MASPLSPATSATLNLATPPTSRRFNTMYGVKAQTSQPTDDHPQSPNNMAENSSPFIPHLQEVRMESPAKENVSPAKARHSRILSGTGIAPFKILSPRDETFDAELKSPVRENTVPRSSRKSFAPEKRFPVKIATGTASPAKTPEKIVTVQEHDITLEDAIRKNEGLKEVIQILEDDSTILEEPEEEEEEEEANVPPTMADQQQMDDDEEDEAARFDDTMVSTFSTFSAVPNMTMFAQIGHSPTRFANMGLTPSQRARPEPSPLRTPRPPVMNESGNTTSLLDFTDQLTTFSARGPPSPSRRNRPSPDRTNGQMPMSTPQRGHSNLLDFDIPPLPTPRSIPTVTPRELESLKSTFLSEISSLKASLMGKEAEVSSLKNAVGDAEKRVGQCMEELREVRGLKDAFSDEKESWEKRGREMESVLRKVKNEIVLGHREKEELEYKLDESEKRREAAEIMAQEAESKMAGMRAGKAADAAAEASGGKSPDKGGKSPGSREVEIAVERVARELHALYKSKHESKVSALKKSYENRWEKRVRELEVKIEDLMDENERLRLGRDATMTRVEPGQAAADEDRKAQAIKNSAQITELHAEVQKLEAVIKSVKEDNQELIQLLEKERVEKGELVQLAEEMMSMQHSFVQQPEEVPSRSPARPAAPKPQEPAAPTYRRSIGRPLSQLRAPGSLSKQTESRIGGLSHERTKSVGLQGGLPRPGSGLATRSGIMSSIEKMGSYRGRGD